MSEANHVVEQTVGGDARKVVRLTVIDPRESRFVPRLDVPKTRADCPPERFDLGYCDRIRCRMNLAREDEPAGRPGLSKVARTKANAGRTVAQPGKLGVQKPTLDPIWLHEGAEICALDAADRAAARGVPLSAAEIGVMFRRDASMIRKLARRAVLKLKAAGVTLAEWLELTDPEGVAADREQTPYTNPRRRTRDIRRAP